MKNTFVLSLALTGALAFAWGCSSSEEDIRSKQENDIRAAVQKTFGVSYAGVTAEKAYLEITVPAEEPNTFETYHFCAALTPKWGHEWHEKWQPAPKHQNAWRPKRESMLSFANALPQDRIVVAHEDKIPENDTRAEKLRAVGFYHLAR